MNTVDLVVRNGRIYPGDIAFVEVRPLSKARTEVTWKQFDERTNSLANALLKGGGEEGGQGLPAREELDQLARGVFLHRKDRRVG